MSNRNILNYFKAKFYIHLNDRKKWSVINMILFQIGFE